ncbi:ATP-binding protein [Saccharothrix variisporea]|uniref:Anti-sigma regulatory factor (Ser/Thr protein kinase) n=1 Tax=Saccharothrix variisporea TaxID=543527 RepID=A0A495X6V5_9PSEU|nr:ATP-binding protein [Saccharothrix variisporea]RKT68744.1 anti-sigma regulatory factor (Ser/Thr protein kinase) [Saccharothrix variisporea]
MTLTFDVDTEAGAAVVHPAGRLDLSTYAQFRDGLLKCALEEPTAVVVVLDDDFEVATPAVMSVFTTVWMRVSEWPGVPVVLVGLGAAHRRLLDEGGAGRFVRHYPSVREALAQREPDRRRDETWLPASPVSALMARRFVRDTCVRWNLPEVLDDALLVVTELVENAVDHGHSAPHLRLELRDRALAIAVRDDEPTPPERREPGTRPGGRGIALVEEISRVWGHTPWPGGGKVVWAVLDPGA